MEKQKHFHISRDEIMKETVGSRPNRKSSLQQRELQARDRTLFCEELVLGLEGLYKNIQLQRAKGKELGDQETEIKSQAGGRKEQCGQRWWCRRTEGTKKNGVPDKHHSATSKPQEEAGVCLLEKQSSWKQEVYIYRRGILPCIKPPEPVISRKLQETSRENKPQNLNFFFCL